MSGYFHEYIAKKLNPQQLETERRAQLARIATLQDSAVLVYAARLTQMPVQVPTAIVYDDLLPFVDMLNGAQRDRITVILETHGGSGEVARDMVEILRERFNRVDFLIPGMAKSAGTIMALGGDEIIMGPTSSLGPIDAQLFDNGKQYSADALLEGLDRIKDEVEKTGKLNQAYIPFLQKLSPGEIEHARNALEFAKKTVREWLPKYKFKDWHTHSSTGKPVTEEEKVTRATEIADTLSSQATWLTHGRSLRIPDLRALKIKILDFSEQPELNDAVMRYHVLLRMTFESGNVYKIFETDQRVLALRFNVQAQAPVSPSPIPQGHASVVANVVCQQCKSDKLQLQLDFVPGVPLQPGARRYPPSGELPCPVCGTSIKLEPVKADIERQIGQKALDPQPTE